MPADVTGMPMPWGGGVIPGQSAGSAQVAGTFGQRMIDVPIIYSAAGGALTSATAYLQVVNPTRRLTCGYQIHFEPTSSQEIQTYGTASWTHYAYDPIGGFRLHELEVGEDLPALYEMDSINPGSLIIATLTPPKTSAPATVPGRWVLRVRWESGIPFCADELPYLYNQCRAQLLNVTPGTLG